MLDVHYNTRGSVKALHLLQLSQCSLRLNPQAEAIQYHLHLL
jgi:hypothetical protein